MKYKIPKDSSFFFELNILLIALQGMAIASELILTGKINHQPGDYFTIEAKYLDMRIRLPLVGPIESALANSHPEFIEIEVIQGRDKEKDFLFVTSGFQRFIDSIFLPFLVNYFEKYKDEIKAKYPAGRDTWPDAWQMGWAVRNAASHNGRVFTKKTEKLICWRKFIFSPYNESDKNLLQLINGGDILILMLEMENLNANL